MSPEATEGGPSPQALALVSLVCARVAHDLNNLLAAIEGYSEFIAQEVTDQPQVLADITEVRRAAANGSAFARRLREVGQLAEYQAEVLDLDELVREAEEQIRLTAGTPLTVALELTPGLPPISADRRQLTMALLSLVRNACDAMPDGGIVKVATAAAGGEVVLAVTDTGPGIPAASRDRLTEAFFSTKPRAVGNGLGLFIADAAVRAAGGRLAFTAAPGGGTSAELVLPSTR